MKKTKITYPNLPADQIEHYKKSGHWPPPAGIILFPNSKPSPENVTKLFQELTDQLSLDPPKSS